MTKSEKAHIVAWAEKLTDFELKQETVKVVLGTLGSVAETMRGQCRDIQDIKECEKYERWLSEKAELLKSLCNKRNIDIWH